MAKPLRWILLTGIGFAAVVGYRTDESMRAEPYPYPVLSDPGAPLKPLFDEQGVTFPPSRLRLLALKEEKVLELWAGSEKGGLRRIATYAITAASGVAGPKRREGDRQVPEGIYRLTDLNPNSKYHLSVRIAYPNQTDVARSKVKRIEMGGDIMLHGGAASIGCIAVGDEAIEHLYDLISKVLRRNRDIVIVPLDFRLRPGFRLAGEEPWVDELYERMEKELQALPLSSPPPPLHEGG
jgi:hypothetical protein